MKGNELKPRIGVFGRRNYGKSSLVNYLTGQNIAIVSDTPGATTDPVRKTMELGGVGPVIWVDTAGIDDVGELGQARVERSFAELEQCDLAIVLLAENRFDAHEQSLLDACKKTKIPYMLLYSQADKVPPSDVFLDDVQRICGTRPLVFSIYDDSRRDVLLNSILQLLPESAYKHKSLLGDVIHEGDKIVMVTPIDSSAPEGRMILPQVQVLRDILDNNAIALVCKESELVQTLASLAAPPKLVVTDSQVYDYVASVVPDDIFLTSFSVVLARAKGLFDDYVKGTPKLSSMNDDDRILLLESCTHNVTCEDIGRVKLPKLIKKFSGKNIHFDVVSGLSSLERPVSDYALVIQCGGCVVSPKQLASRLAPAVEAGVPVSNYGLAIAYMNGIFERSMRIFNQN